MSEPGKHQILRIETHQRLDSRLVEHVKGVTRPPTARPVDPTVVSVHPPVELGAIFELGGAGAGAGRDAIERTRPTGRGRKPMECFDVVIAGPPSYGSPEQWSDARELEWARESYEWLRDMVGPESVIVTAQLHRDEKSPHVQAIVIPIHNGRLGWKGVRDAAVKRIDRDLGRRSRTKYSGLQDSYQAVVGRRFGLDRGQVGSQAKHEQIDRAIAAEHRAELARASAADLDRQSGEYSEAVASESERYDKLRVSVAELVTERRTLQTEVADLVRSRDQHALAERVARETREREEAIGGGLLSGRRSARGRAVLEEAVAAGVEPFKRRVAELEPLEGRVAELERTLGVVGVERDTAIAERDAANERATKWERWCNAARKRAERAEAALRQRFEEGVALGRALGSRFLGAALTLSGSTRERSPGMWEYHDQLADGRLTEDDVQILESRAQSKAPTTSTAGPAPVQDRNRGDGFER